MSFRYQRIYGGEMKKAKKNGNAKRKKIKYRVGRSSSHSLWSLWKWMVTNAPNVLGTNFALAV